MSEVPLPSQVKHRLKLRLAAFIGLTALVGTFLLSQLVTYLTVEQIVKDKGNLLHDVATQMTDRLSQDMDVRANEIQFLTRLPGMHDLSTSMERRRTVFELTKASYPHYAWIGVTDPQGNIVAGTGGMLEGKSVAQRDWFIEGSKGLHFGNAHDAFLLAKLLPKPQWDDLPLRLVDVSAPVEDAAGNLLGVICGHLSLDWAFEVRNRMVAGLNEPGVEVVVLNHEGKVLMGTPGLPSLQVDLGGLQAVNRAVEAHGDPLVETWPDGVRYLTTAVRDEGFRSYAGMGWVVVARIPEAQALASAHEIGRRIALLGVLFALAFAAALWLILSRQLRPLERLSHAAERIRAEDPHTRIPAVQGDDEIAVFARSLTELVGALQSRNEELRLTSRVFEESSQGIIITDAQERILRVNRAFTEITQYAAEEVIGQTPRLFKSHRQARAFYDAMWASIRHHGFWRGEIWNRGKSGRVFPEWMNINALKDAEGRITHYIALFEDTTEKKEYEERLLHLANYDVLTELPNRHLLQQRLSVAIEQGQKDGGGLALLFVDLDHFKHINDTLGHPAGDKVLGEVANRFRTALPEGATLARWGGDEFVAVVSGAQGREAAEVAGALLRALDAPFAIEGREYGVNASIGIALFPEDGGNVDALLRCADTAMYRAKETGKNRYCFYEPAMNQRMEEFLRYSSGLLRAITNGELSMAYQPQFDGAGRHIVAAEALLRWNSAELGPVSPALFIPIAEETGAIHALGDWALGRVLVDLGRMIAGGGEPVPVAVNFSSHQITTPQFPDHIHALVTASGVTPALLKIEVTESAIMEDEEMARDNLARLKGLGYAISIDDFGTGYSCLAYITRLKPNELKIDKSFVQSVDTDVSSRDVVAFTVDLAKHMGMGVVAEGVETAEQLSRLQAMGTVHIQGYLLGRPMPFDALLGLVKAG